MPRAGPFRLDDSISEFLELGAAHKKTARVRAVYRESTALLPNVAVAQHDKFLSGQPFKAHRPPGVELVRRNPDFGA